MSAYETPTQDGTDTEQTMIVAGDGGEILTEPRPDDCVCWEPKARLPCFTCYLAGFDEPNPNAGQE